MILNKTFFGIIKMDELYVSLTITSIGQAHKREILKRLDSDILTVSSLSDRPTGENLYQQETLVKVVGDRNINLLSEIKTIADEINTITPESIVIM